LADSAAQLPTHLNLIFFQVSVFIRFYFVFAFGTVIAL